jgi:hypothetical protein
MRLLVTVLFLASFGAAQAADSAWVQATVSGYEARIATTVSTCPTLSTDKGDAPMTVRAPANADFPMVCAAPMPKGTTRASIAGQSLPVPVAQPQRILVLGDTGCRIKGAALQACNDPAAWPFPQLADAAAKLKPDLVVHVGDYHYRESACPAGVAGCAGSPWGDNWITWQADFFTPAAPLLAAAPIVAARGNHEDCTRAGKGWAQALSPLAGASCAAHEPLYGVDLGDVRLAVMDDATAPETQIIREDIPTYAAELEQMAAMPAPVWFLHHRPIWAAVSGPLGIPIGGNLTLMDATREYAAKAGPRIPASVSLMLSGHIHSFQAINYDAGSNKGVVPPQIVAGNGGDNLHVTPQNLRGTQFQGVSGVSVADGLSVGGFGFLMMTRQGAGWNIQLYDEAGQPQRRCEFAPAKGKAGRLDCPDSK